MNAIDRRLVLSERLESISLLEEALWKMKIDSFHAENEEDETLSDHERHHLGFRCGASVAISHVLPYRGMILDVN